MNAQTTRRSLLGVTGAAFSVGLCGCLETVVPDADEAEALVAELWVYDRQADRTEPVADTHHHHWHGEIPDIRRGSVLSLGAEFKNHDRESIPIGDDEPYHLQARRVGDTLETMSVDSHGDHLRIVGEEIGESDIIFQLAERDETLWEAPPIGITVRPA